jgi:hypothetical protein
MSREEHVITSLIPLAIRLLIGRLILGHLLFITLAVFAGSVGLQQHIGVSE